MNRKLDKFLRIFVGGTLLAITVTPVRLDDDGHYESHEHIHSEMHFTDFMPPFNTASVGVSGEAHFDIS